MHLRELITAMRLNHPGRWSTDDLHMCIWDLWARDEIQKETGIGYYLDDEECEIPL